MATAPKKGRRAPGTQGGPWRPLLLFLLLAAVLTGGMFLSGHTTPRLGIDLAGGTSITLTVDESESEKSAINQSNLNTAASIIERRVNGLGVAEAEVQTQGDRNIVVNIPKGTDEAQAREQVGTTAQLFFRPVLAIAAGIPAPEPEPSGSEGADKADAADKDADKDAAAKENEGDKADEKAPDEDEKATPSPSTTSQGRAVTDGLRADESASPSSSPADGEKDGEKKADGEKDSESGKDEPVAADNATLQKKFETLDCTDPAERTEANRGTDGEDSIVACGPPTENPAESAKYLLGPAAVDGTDVSSAEAGFDSQRGQGWIVQMEFDDKGTKKFADITEQLSVQASPQNQFAIVLDGEVVSAPSVSERLGGGSAEISGTFNQQSAEELANVLKYGALPLAFEEGTVTTISPTLGAEQLRAGLIAGGIGLVLVAAYLLFYYRALAVVAISSLVGAAILTYTIMTLLGPAIGFALSLPAVCGAIVAIGITADSFIVYFERIRDEVREGRSIRPSVERAWPRARHTVLVSDVVSLIAAVVLFIVSIGSVQGFAFVLGLTTVVDLGVVFLLTKPLTSLLARRKFVATGHPWSGLDPKRLGVRPPLRGGRPATAPAAPKEA